MQSFQDIQAYFATAVRYMRIMFMTLPPGCHCWTSWPLTIFLSRVRPKNAAPPCADRDSRNLGPEGFRPK